MMATKQRTRKGNLALGAVRHPKIGMRYPKSMNHADITPITVVMFKFRSITAIFKNLYRFLHSFIKIYSWIPTQNILCF